MVEQKEISRGFVREIVLTYARQLRESIIHHPIETAMTAAVIALGLHVFAFSEAAAFNRQVLPKMGIAVVGAFALGVPFAALAVRSERRRFAEITARNILQMHRENAEDIERNDIMPGLQY